MCADDAEAEVFHWKLGRFVQELLVKFALKVLLWVGQIRSGSANWLQEHQPTLSEQT